MNSNYGPKDFWQVKKERNLKFNESITLDDPRYVDLNKGRGETVFDRLLKPLGFDKDYNPRLIDTTDNHYILFCGHRGCGKSTELSGLSQKLHRPDGYFVVDCNIMEELDPNNIEYVDILFLAAKKLADRLIKDEITIDKQHIKDLEAFFEERIITQIKAEGVETSIKAGVKTKIGFEFVAAIFGHFTSGFKSNATYKEEVRTSVKNNFSLFKTIFNRMVDAINEKIKKSNRGKNLLIIIDGSDKIEKECCEKIFINNASQLIQIETNFIYTVPIHLIYESRQIKNYFDHYMLPMVILENQRTGQPNNEGWDAMREMLFHRVHPDLFDSNDTINRIIKMSGGYPREMLHILQETFNASDTEKFDADSVEKGLNTLKADYMRILEEKDYKRLIRLAMHRDKESDGIMTNLLYNSVVLEYNSYWREVNPIVAESEDYKKALKNHGINR